MLEDGLPSNRGELLARGGAFFEIEDGGNDFLHGDFFHAAEVDRAFAEEAGAAFHFLADDFAAGAAGASEDGFGGAENSDQRCADEVGEVHGAGVVGQETAELRKQIHQLAERRLSCEVGDIRETA